MAVVNTKDTCNSCLFFVVGERMGVCKRYPSAVNKSNDDWCGDFSAIKNKAIEAITEKLGGFEIQFVEPPKQRGRPKKS
jgi:hypothetical protein